MDLNKHAESETIGLPPLWRNRDYMLLWGGQLVSTTGSSASGIVFPLLILALTNSPAAAGIAAAMRFIPYILLSLPAGALVDRWDRKRIMILCDTGRSLALASIPVAMYFGVLTIWQIYLAALAEGSLFVFFNLAEVAMISRVVPKSQLPEATGQINIMYGVADIVGPSLGTTLYQTLSQAAPFIFDAVSYAASVVGLLFVKTHLQVERTTVKLELRHEIMEGLRWLWSQRLVRFMAFLTGGLNGLWAGAFLLIIVLAKQSGAADAQIGIVFSLGAVGGIIGGLVGPRFQKRFRFGQVIAAAVWTQALLFPLLALAPNFIVMGAILLFIYITGPIYDAVQFSYRMALIPDELQGRVNSNFRLLVFGFQPLGAALSGFLIERIGVVPALMVFSGFGLVLGIVTLLNGSLRNAQPLPKVQAT